MCRQFLWPLPLKPRLACRLTSRSHQLPVLAASTFLGSASVSESATEEGVTSRALSTGLSAPSPPALPLPLPTSSVMPSSCTATISCFFFSSPSAAGLPSVSTVGAAEACGAGPRPNRRQRPPPAAGADLSAAFGCAAPGPFLLPGFPLAVGLGGGSLQQKVASSTSMPAVPAGKQTGRQQVQGGCIAFSTPRQRAPATPPTAAAAAAAHRGRPAPPRSRGAPPA